jgi:hypothetical protein
MNKNKLLYFAPILAISISSGSIAFGSSDMDTVLKLIARDKSDYEVTYNALKAVTEPNVLSCNKSGGQEIEVEFDLNLGRTPKKIRAVISGTADVPLKVVINPIENSVNGKTPLPYIKDIQVDYSHPTASAVQMSEETLRAAMSKISWYVRKNYYMSNHIEYHQTAMRIIKPDPASPKAPQLQGIVQIGGNNSYIDGLANGISASLPSFWKGIHERCANGTQVLGTQAIGNATPSVSNSPTGTSSGAILTSQ